MDILLSNGMVALVDEDDYPNISMHKWHPLFIKSTESYYAYRLESGHGLTRSILMHREILGLVYKDGKICDHIDPNLTLDNRKSNLRVTDHRGNGRNCRKPSHNTSGIKGVCWAKLTSKWQAQIRVNKKVIYLGQYINIEDAHKAYCEASVKYHGEFSRIE